MIKITAFFDEKCKVLFEVEPTRRANIHEPKLGLAVAKASTDYCVTKEGKIYRSISGITLDYEIKRLKEIQDDAQEEFSKRIQKLKNKLDEFNLLLELTKKEKAKQ